MLLIPILKHNRPFAANQAPYLSGHNQCIVNILIITLLKMKCLANKQVELMHIMLNEEQSVVRIMIQTAHLEYFLLK